MLLRMPLIPVGPQGGMAEPMYRVIADDLAQQIESGKLRVGAQLKTEVELREEYRRPDAPISRTTVRDAINQVGWRDQFFVRPPDGNERAFFNLSDRVQVAILDVRRTGYDEEGNPIRVTVTVYPGDRNQFEMEAGKVPPPPSAPKS